MKRIITAFLLGSINIFLNPVSLAASDFVVVKQPDFAAADALMVARKNTDLAAEVTENAVDTSQVASSVWTGMAEAASPLQPASKPSGEFNVAAPAAGGQPAPSVVQPASQTSATYRVTVVLGTLKEYLAVSQNPSYTDVYRFKHLIFAHNTSTLLGSLRNLSVGQVISVAENGAVTNFRVSAVSLYENTASGLDGDPEFINKLVAHAMGHDLALLTCAGTPYGNGNATHRLVIYADAV